MTIVIMISALNVPIYKQSVNVKRMTGVTTYLAST